MKAMKRMLTWSLALCLILGLLAGCGQTGTETPEATETPEPVQEEAEEPAGAAEAETEEPVQEEQTLTVRFDDERECTYEGAQLDDLELAYCVSVHKSQGSEFPAVVMPAVGGPPMLLTRNLFYTAVTRARRAVVLVGREAVVSQMVQNARTAKRYSALAEWLRNAP